MTKLIVIGIKFEVFREISVIYNSIVRTRKEIRPG